MYGDTDCMRRIPGGGAELLHCPTGAMIADALTKLATADVVKVLHEAMSGSIPAVPACGAQGPLSGSPGVATSRPVVDELD